MIPSETKSETTPAPSSPKSWRDSTWLAFVEFLIVALIFYADYRRLIPFSKTPELLLLGWISLRVRNLRWRDIGLTRYRSWPVTIAIGVVLGVLTEAFQLLITQPILSRLVGKQPDLELFRMLTGNLKMTLLFIALSWTLAAFGEELFWRGYLMNRVADVGGRNRAAWIVSLVIVNMGTHRFLAVLRYISPRNNPEIPLLQSGRSVPDIRGQLQMPSSRTDSPTPST
jgi:hypothetical protein